jgi:hypothetical protein
VLRNTPTLCPDRMNSAWRVALYDPATNTFSFCSKRLKLEGPLTGEKYVAVEVTVDLKKRAHVALGEHYIQ